MLQCSLLLNHHRYVLTRHFHHSITWASDPGRPAREEWLNYTRAGTLLSYTQLTGMPVDEIHKDNDCHFPLEKFVSEAASYKTIDSGHYLKVEVLYNYSFSWCYIYMCVCVCVCVWMICHCMKDKVQRISSASPEGQGCPELAGSQGQSAANPSCAKMTAGWSAPWSQSGRKCGLFYLSKYHLTRQ